MLSSLCMNIKYHRTIVTWIPTKACTCHILHCHNLLPRVPNPAQVVQLQVPRETGSFCTHTLLAAGTGRGGLAKETAILRKVPSSTQSLTITHTAHTLTHQHPSPTMSIIAEQQPSEMVTKPLIFRNTFHPSYSMSVLQAAIPSKRKDVKAK